MKTKTIDLILEAAEKEISSKGIDGAKIELIARDAGVTKQLIYHYFKTKDELYRAVLESTSQRIQILTDVDLYSELAPVDAISHFINTIFKDFIENPMYRVFTIDQALHDGEHITESSLFLPTMRVFIREVFSPILERGSDEGVFKKGLDPDVTFWLIFNLAASCFFNTNIMSATSAIDFNDETSISKFRQSVIDLVLNGLCG